MSLHVCHFIHRYPPALGGAEAYFHRLTEFLKLQHHDVTVWTTTAQELQEMWFPERGPGFPEMHSGPLLRFRPRALPLRRYLLKLGSLIPVRPWQLMSLSCNPLCPGMWREAGRFSGPVDLVHASAVPYGWPLMCGLRLARRRKVPYFLTPFLHLGDPQDPWNKTRKQYLAPQFRWLLQQADRIFVQTRLEFQGVAELGVPEERIILQGLGVDPGECTGGDRGAFRQRFNIPGEAAVIGHLANLSEEKGTVDLLKSVQRLQNVGRPVHVLLAGPEMPNFRKFWDQLPGSTSVHKIGPLTEVERRDFFAAIDIFALPSRTDSFGLVLLEAWANGKPNVCYRAGGPSEIVHHGQDGLLATCGDVTELAEQLRLLIRDPRLGETLGRAGLSRLPGEFHWPTKLALVEEQMRKLCPGSKHALPMPSQENFV